ncbi:MAG: ATP-binding protein [Kiritimatiellia bacterium]|nr:ATP-binding protein [Kiritimatiellia bacterium]
MKRRSANKRLEPNAAPAAGTARLMRVGHQPHDPIPRNPLITEPLFRVKYVEKAGTGTTDMIADCLAAGLPEPNFRQCGPHFVTTLWRDCSLCVHVCPTQAIQMVHTNH